MNPYRRDTFLSGMLGQSERFMGLRDELEWLLARLSEGKPAAVSLVGPWGVGKSFLLAWLANLARAWPAFAPLVGPRFRDDRESLLFVMLDFEEHEPRDVADGQLLALLYERTLERLAELLQIDDVRMLPLDRLPAARQLSVVALRALVKRTLDQALVEADQQELRERFEAALAPALPNKLIELLKRADGWGIRVVFLIDEFDNVAGQLSRADFDHLRALLSAASMVLATRKALSDIVPPDAQTSSFFGLVERLNLVSLHFLSLEEARRVIVEPPGWFPASATFQWSAADVEFILEMTGPHLDLIRASCEYLYMWTHRRQPGAGEDLIAAERQFFRARLHPPFADPFANLWRRLSDGERAILGVIAAGEVSVADAQKLAPASVLHSLINRGYVTCEQGCYRLFAGLFRDYVLGQAGAAARPAITSPELDERDLTDLEKQLLAQLKARPGEPVDRDTIVEQLYGVRPGDHDARLYDNRLDALIFRLRGKLAQQPALIENIRGQGYRLVWIKNGP